MNMENSMKIAAMLAAVVGLATGCGPSFVGHFSGTGRTVGTCSDGSPLNVASAFDWQLSEQGSAVTIATNGNCGNLSAVAAGNTASLNRLSCPDVVFADGSRLTTAFTGGTLTLNEPTLSISLRQHLTLTSGGVTGTCDPIVTGSLTRQNP
jgi:hypothetical protein